MKKLMEQKNHNRFIHIDLNEPNKIKEKKRTIQNRTKQSNLKPNQQNKYISNIL